MLSAAQFISFMVSMAFFMESLDTSIIHTAVPSIAMTLNIQPLALKMALISYFISLAIFIPISGWVADKYGIKKVFIASMGIFTVSSFFCGLADQLITLVVARTAQGIGGAFMVPVGRLIIVRFFKKHQLMKTMNHIVLLALFGQALGPLLGGLIVHFFSWRWIFWINIPPGLLCIGLTCFFLENSPVKKIPPLDKKGFVYFGLGLAGLTLGLATLSEMPFNHFFAGLLFSGSVCVLLFYAHHAHKLPAHYYRILNPALFKLRTFSVAAASNFFIRLSTGALPFLMALFLQVNLGYSALVSGCVSAFMAAGAAFTKLFSKKLLGRFGFKMVLLINTFSLALIISLFGFLHATAPLILFIVLMFLFGITMSLAYSGMNPLYFSDIDPAISGAATSFQSANMQLAQGMAVSLWAFVLHTSHYAFAPTFWAMASMTVLSAFIFFFLKKNDGANLLGQD